MALGQRELRVLKGAKTRHASIDGAAPQTRPAALVQRVMQTHGTPSQEEVLRLLDGLQTDELCPCNRGVGGATL